MTTKTHPRRSHRETGPPLQLIESTEQLDERSDGAGLPLEIVVRPGTDIHGVALVLLSGRVDIDSAPRVRAAIEELVRAHRRYILVDLDGVTSRDADSYEELIEAACSAVQRDVTVLFTSDPRCMLMLKVADDEAP